MSAGTGITHSEFNPSADEPVHLYQIWLLPAEKGVTPSYEQKRFAPAEMADRWRLVAAPDAANGALAIHQDARVYLATLAAGRTVTHELSAGRYAWLQVLRGAVTLDDERLVAGDGAALSDVARLDVSAEGANGQTAEVMLFDLA
jgi:redox-sensitive bicupin YhaK (pirin superfamily)